MTPEDAIKKLVEIRKSPVDDPESSHLSADAILLDVLQELGYEDVSNAYIQTSRACGFWYA